MIIYNVTYSIDPAIEAEWLHWMKEDYVVRLLQTKLMDSCKILHLLTEIDNGAVTYTLQMSFAKTEHLVAFEEAYENSLENQHHIRFEGKYASFRTLLKEIYGS